MKKSLLVFAIALLGFSACKNDFVVNAPFKEVPVVYGLLDYDSSMQYIKVERVFVDPVTSALLVAQKPDSLYYPSSLVVEIMGFNDKNVQMTTHTFSLVNGDTIPGFQKEAGVFASSPNYFYRLKSKLNPAYYYRLSIRKADGTVIASSKTNLVNNSTFTNPNPFTNPYYITFVNRYSDPQDQVKYSFLSGKYGKVFDVVVRMHYTEINKVSHDTSYKTIDCPVATNIVASSDLTGENLEANYNGQNFFSYLNVHLKKDQNLARVATTFDILLYSGSAVFKTYMDVSLAQSGFTAGNVQPDYTNIENGLGIFASRHITYKVGALIKSPSLDSLRKGRYSGGLGFI